MSHRQNNPEQLILPKVIETKGTDWNDATQKVAQSDAQRVLEAMLAEFGLEEAIRALDNQGFQGASYGYLLKPLHEEAVRRRQRAQAPYSRKSTKCHNGGISKSVFSPKGWEFSAQGKERSDAALGQPCDQPSSPKGCDNAPVSALRAERYCRMAPQGGGPSALALG